MHKTLVAAFEVLVISIVVLGAAPLRAEETTVAYADDFSTVKGYRTTNTNGAFEEGGGARTRQIYTFMGDSITGGKLSITAAEDSKASGPDGKPGLLSLSYDQLPIAAEYSGFVYDGRMEDPIKLPNFKGQVGEGQLKQVKVSFQYKAVNANQSNVGADYNCRFETVVQDPYEHRVDFGVLSATGKWQTFTRVLSQGSNVSQFLSAVNGSPDAPFRLVWAQEGEVSSYDQGDTLLIDEIEITITE